MDHPIREHHLPVTRTAHYYSIGNPGPEVRNLVIACHGYGQLASRFIRKFTDIAGPETLVLAPEGLSRFYWQGFSGEIAASWMTSKDRLHEIADYANYLQQLYEAYLPRLHPDCRIILLGFSQGCATVVRWIMHHFPKVHHLAFWGGTIPEDLDYRPRIPYFSGITIDFFYGTEDPFLTPERLEFNQSIIEKNQLAVRTTSFTGKHTIDRATLREWYTGLVSENG